MPEVKKNVKYVNETLIISSTFRAFLTSATPEGEKSSELHHEEILWGVS